LSSLPFADRCDYQRKKNQKQTTGNKITSKAKEAVNYFSNEAVAMFSAQPTFAYAA